MLFNCRYKSSTVAKSTHSLAIMARKGKQSRLKERSKEIENAAKGAVSKLIWAICITFCLLGVIYIVARQMKEQSDHPISSTIKSVPTNKVPFPVVTFYSQNQEASYETFFEDLLNMFVVDCSFNSKLDANETLQEIEMNRQCQARSQRLRQLFNEQIQRAARKMLSGIKYDLRQLFNKQSYSMRSILCYNLKKRPIMSKLHLFHSWNASKDYEEDDWKETLTFKLSNLFAENFGLPSRESEQYILEKLADLADEYNYNVGNIKDNECFAEVKQMDLSTATILGALDILDASNHFSFHLGTLLRESYFSAKEIQNLSRNFFNFTQKENSYLQTIFSFDSYNQFGDKLCCPGVATERMMRAKASVCWTCDDTNNLTSKINFIKKNVPPVAFVNDIMLGISQFAENHKKEQMLQKAREVIENHHLPANAIQDKVPERPQLWFCASKYNDFVDCPKTYFTFTERGYGHSLNMGKWEDTFKIKNPNHFGTPNSIQLTANNELQLYLYNRNTK